MSPSVNNAARGLDAKKMTTIKSNGSKWAGQEPDSVEYLLKVLNDEPLDRTFENYGNFVYLNENNLETVVFFGNFFRISHVFNIETDDESTIENLISAIEANRRRSDYSSQKIPKLTEHDAAKATVRGLWSRGKSLSEIERQTGLVVRFRPSIGFKNLHRDIAAGLFHVDFTDKELECSLSSLQGCSI